ncbi:hypothetical protein R3P38DRAFT_2647270 [Favolaschia claudopus]|uniref:Uncharacterized protein n=1 Tax=Favolaschia claudopus TaxID=2862362 RepID=A0AAW0A942_9AGAR
MDNDDATPPSPQLESEMSRHQRNLVDLCLEEGQYEQAIDVLNQLRAPNLKPSAAHIRQLLFIALYSSRDSGADKTLSEVTASPSKRPKKSHLLPSPGATLASQQLLVSFAITNSPAAVIRALRPAGTDAAVEGDNESLVATESMCISRCKNCWEILADGFLARNRPNPKGKGKQNDSSFDLDVESQIPVGESAWPVLDWLLLIFERDEQANPTLPRHSVLLLEQLGTPTRRNTDASLSVVMYCLQQSDERRRMMGSRLMNLLINLSSTTQLDFPMLILSVFNHLSPLSQNDISSFMSSLTPSPAVSKFKIALYQKYFSDSNDAARVAARPRPQARAQPKGSPVKARAAPVEAPPLVNRYRPPGSSEILRLMEATTTAPSVSVDSLYKLKFELLVSYNAYQTEASATDKDPEWPNILRNGIMAKTLDSAFGCKTGGTEDPGSYRDLLKMVLNVH